LRKTRTQIVHSNNWSTFVEAAAAKLLAGAPALVHTQHGLEYGGWSSSSLLKRSLRRAGVAFAVGMNDAIVSVSKAGQEWCRRHWRVPDGKSVLISNGIELPLGPDPPAVARVRCELGLGTGDLVVGSIGTLRPVKNFPGLVRAFSTIVERLPCARLLIVGDGPERGALEELISGLELDSAARLVGPRSDIPELLAVMDVFALASHSEGMSLAVLEALGAGVPVVATRVGGNPEIVHDGECGILVEPGDEAGLSKALVSLLSDDGRRRRMGVAGRSLVASSYSLDAMTELYEELYTRLLRPG
jgi:glycosyltransferase involved in cell wall biosynthesis